MRKIASNIFVALFILCFASQKSFAFSNPYSNANPKCKKYDLYCKRTSQKMSAEEVKKMSYKLEASKREIMYSRRYNLTKIWDKGEEE